MNLQHQEDDYILSILAAYGQELQSMKGQTESGRCMVIDKYGLALTAYLKGRVIENASHNLATNTGTKPEQINYEAYCSARNWKSFNGDPLPQWLEVKPDIQDGWRFAAEAVRAHLLQELAEQKLSTLLKT